MTTVGKLLSGAAVIALAAVFATGEAAAQPAKPEAKPADAKGKGQNKGSKRAGAKGDPAVAYVQAAHELVRYGDQNKDALALITAARILNGVGAQEKQREAQQKGAKGQATKQAPDMSVKAILERAKQYAGDRKDLIALADDAATATRGRAAGPVRGWNVVASNSMQWYRWDFRANERASVAISGDGDTDLDLYVFDENNNLICRADGASDDEVCHWQPRWTGSFRIEVRNMGRVANRYGLATN